MNKEEIKEKIIKEAVDLDLIFTWMLKRSEFAGRIQSESKLDKIIKDGFTIRRDGNCWWVYPNEKAGNSILTGKEIKELLSFSPNYDYAQIKDNKKYLLLC